MLISKKSQHRASYNYIILAIKKDIPPDQLMNYILTNKDNASVEVKFYMGVSPVPDPHPYHWNLHHSSTPRSLAENGWYLYKTEVITHNDDTTRNNYTNSLKFETFILVSRK